MKRLVTYKIHNKAPYMTRQNIQTIHYIQLAKAICYASLNLEELPAALGGVAMPAEFPAVLAGLGERDADLLEFAAGPSDLSL